MRLLSRPELALFELFPEAQQHPMDGDSERSTTKNPERPSEHQKF